MIKKINQGLTWFLESDYFTGGDVPVTSLYPNNVTGVDSYISKDPDKYTGFNINTHKKGNKLIIQYSNEATLNYLNLPEETNTAIAKETYKVKELINYLNIPIKDVILVGSIYEMAKSQTQVGLNIGLKPEQIILIDYYEMQTFLFHKMYDIEYNKQYNSSAKKDLKYIFGKAHKINRLIAMHELWLNGMLENALTGFLVKTEDLHKVSFETVKEYKKLYNVNVSEEDILLMLKKYHGPVDDTEFKYFKKTHFRDSAIDISNFCACYPYNHELLFTDTKVSLIPETMFHRNHPTFVTEKTYIAMHNHHPFTILGTPNFLGTLKNKGYRTFDQVCDESYDHCFNDKKRLKMVINSTKELMDSNNDEIIHSVTKHNFRQLQKNALITIEHFNDSLKKVL